MMTTLEDHANSAQRPASSMQVALASLVAIFLGGSCAGAIAASYEKGFTSKRAAILAVLVALTVTAAWWAIRVSRRALHAGEPVAPRIQRARSIFYVSAALGVGAGFVLGIFHGLDVLHGDAFSGPLSPLAAALVIAVTLAMMPLTWAWYRSIDELEASAYNVGAAVALHGYMFAAPIWWLAWRAGFAPEPNGVAIYFLTMVLWSAVWLWRRPR